VLGVLEFEPLQVGYGPLFGRHCCLCVGWQRIHTEELSVLGSFTREEIDIHLKRT
jgi:hypothetical protein